MMQFRSNMMKVVEIDGIRERDINYSHWDKFQISRPIKYYKISHRDIARPDIVSYSVYGTTDYWWVLMKFNNIDDVWNDMPVGRSIKVPDLQDITEWLAKI